MNLRYVLLGSILILAALSGCTGGGEGGDTTTTTTAAPATTAPPATTVAAPVTTAPAAEAVLHGVGTCDMCHAAPAMDEWSSGGLMGTAFEKNPGHKDFCKNCHEIETHCVECHAMPSVMTPASETTEDAASQ